MKQIAIAFHKIWKNLLTWIRGIDIESIKKDAGIKSAEE